MAKTTFELYVKEKDSKKIKKVFKLKTADDEEVEVYSSLNGGPRLLEKSIVVDVSEGPEPPTEFIVDAGEDQTVFEGATITLDGSTTGLVDKAKWSSPDNIDLTPGEDPTIVTFTAPKLTNTDVLGLVFNFQAIDEKGRVKTDKAIVTVIKKGNEVPVNTPPVIETNLNISGVVGQQVDIMAKITDLDGTVEDVNFLSIPGSDLVITQTDNPPNYVGSFIPTAAGTYPITIEVFDNENARVTKTVNVQVEEMPGPPPEPTDEVLYDSQRDSKLHDGKTRTVTKEGDISPGGLGIECRASGNPRIQVNDDGTYSLICDAGHGRYYLYCKNYDSTMELEAAFWNEAPGQDISKKKRSQHNEGGACENRPGGYGESNDRKTYNAKRETCHNNHDQAKSGNLPIEIKTKEFHTYRFTVKDENGKVRQTASIDGQKYMDKIDSSPGNFIDEARFMKQSYEWVRQNIDSGTGEIRIKRHRVLKA